MKLFSFLKKSTNEENPKQILQKLEDVLITSDFGFNLSEKLISKIKEETKAKSQQELIKELRKCLIKILEISKPFEILGLEKSKNLKKQNPRFAQLILNIGTNGVGKTTSCAKMAHYYKNQGYRTVLVAADTFRSGAVNQLKIWAKKYNIYFFETDHQDPSAISYSAIESLSEDFDLIIIDSAGRSPNESNLMNQLAKLQRIVAKSKILHKTILTLDGTNGTQAKEQVKLFSEYLNIDGLIITKLDGSAKAGILFAITEKYQLPVSFIGIGEKIEDLKIFKPENFVSQII